MVLEAGELMLRTLPWSDNKGVVLLFNMAYHTT